MSWALLRKELAEHGVVLAVTGLLTGLLLFAMLLQADRDLGGRFVGLIRFSFMFGWLIPLVLAHRLLVREYGGRTQLFLETLPIGRARAFATKWLLGCGLTLLAAGLGWLAALQSIRRSEVLPWQDAAGTGLAVGVFWFTAWCFASMAGMLGRYRYVVWAACALCYLVLTSVAGVPLREAPVIRLLGPDVQMARGVPDPAVFLTALAIAFASAAGAAVLALHGAGAMSSALARRMTARERVFVLVAFAAVLTVAAMLERKPEQPPFEITDGERVQGRYATVGVMPTVDVDAATARDLARILVEDSDELIDALALDTRPPIFILPQQGLDRTAMQRAAVSGAEGIVIRVAPNAPRDRVRSLVGHSVLVDATHARAIRDDRHVLLDGLTAHWALRDDDDARSLWQLRAAAAVPSVAAGDLTGWARTSEQLGECIALALSLSVYDVLVEQLGTARTLALMRDVFAAPHDDARALLERRPAAQLADAGLDWATLAELTRARHESLREQHAAAIASRLAVKADIAARRVAGRGVEIEVRIDGAERFAVHYARLRPWTRSVEDMPRLDVHGQRTVLPLSSARGDRVLVAVELDDPILDCPVRIAAERLEIQ